MQKLPRFLVIGAMKSGTTTLFRDLVLNPGIFEPVDKEPDTLTTDDILTPSGLARYAETFANAREDQLCFEASTSYTKRPVFDRVPERAFQVLGAGLKILYIVREPVSRILSHHHHDLQLNLVGPDINAAVRNYPNLLNFSRYAFQIKPWIERFGPDQIRVIRFEDYVKDRRGTVRTLSEFLGVEPALDKICEEEVFNRTESKPMLGKLMLRVAAGSLYRRLVRPMLSLRARDNLRKKFLPKAKIEPLPPTAGTVDYLIERLVPDLAELQQLPGCSGLVWDLSEAKAKVLRPASGHVAIP